MANLVEVLEEKGGEFVSPMISNGQRGQVWKFSSYKKAEEILFELGEIAKPWNFIPWQNHYPENECPTIFVRMN